MDINQIKNLIRVGTVSAVNGKSCCARVGTQVLCIFQPNASGSGISKGFVIGAFYSTQDAPVESNADVRSITFADGSFIRYENGDIEINAKGNVIIKGANILLN